MCLHETIAIVIDVANPGPVHVRLAIDVKPFVYVGVCCIFRIPAFELGIDSHSQEQNVCSSSINSV